MNLKNAKELITPTTPVSIPTVITSKLIINKVEISAPLNVGSANCSNALNLIPKDENNSVVIMDRDLSVKLTASGASIFYSDSNCTTVITDAVIPLGSSSKTIYIKSTSIGSQTLTASSPNAKSDFLNSIFVKGVTKVAAGNTHTCALFNDSTVKCWGFNGSFYLIGDGTTTDRYIPTLVSGISNATDIAVGSRHSCAVLTDQTIKCWGYNSSGSLGSGNTSTVTVPVSVVGINSAISVMSNAAASHTCALLDDQTMRCWGYGYYGQLGDGSSSNSSTPLNPGFTNVRAIAVGDYHTCVLFTAGNIKCVGGGASGQLGDGNIVNNTSWVDVTGITNATEIYASTNITCAKLLTGEFQCWGSNGYGKLGDPSTNGSNVLIPRTITVPGGSFLGYSAGASFGCLLLTDHTVTCAGAMRQESSIIIQQLIQFLFFNLVV